MIENIFIKILFLIFVCVIVYIIYDFFNQQYLKEHLKCNIDNYNIDDLVIIKRTPEYSKLIDELIDKKSFIFTDEQIKVLKNPQQIFNVSNNNNNNNISNISDVVYTKCKNELDENTFDFNNINNNDYKENFDNIIDVSNEEYTDIKNMLKRDINKLIGPNCFNTGVLNKICH